MKQKSYRKFGIFLGMMVASGLLCGSPDGVGANPGYSPQVGVQGCTTWLDSGDTGLWHCHCGYDYYEAQDQADPVGSCNKKAQELASNQSSNKKKVTRTAKKSSTTTKKVKKSQ